MAEDKPFSQLEDEIPFYKKRSFFMFLFFSLAVIVFLLFMIRTVRESMSTEEVGKSVQIVFQDTRWVDKRIRPGEAIIVPSITFKVKNMGVKLLKNVAFQGVFQYDENNENLSDGYVIALQGKGLQPGETSDDIFLKGSFGYTASSKQAFVHNINEWKQIKVRMYARAYGSDYALLGVYPVKQEIEGIKIVYGEESEAPPPAEESKK